MALQLTNIAFRTSAACADYLLVIKLHRAKDGYYGSFDFIVGGYRGICEKSRTAKAHWKTPALALIVLYNDASHYLFEAGYRDYDVQKTMGLFRYLIAKIAYLCDCLVRKQPIYLKNIEL